MSNVLDRESSPSISEASRSSHPKRPVITGSVAAAIAAGVLTVVGAQGRAQAQEAVPFPDVVNMDPRFSPGVDNIASAGLFQGVGNNVRLNFATTPPGANNYGSFSSDWRIEGSDQPGTEITVRLLGAPTLRHMGGSSYIEFRDPNGQLTHTVESPTYGDAGDGTLFEDQRVSIDGVEADPEDYGEVGTVGAIQKGLLPNEVVYTGQIVGANRWNEWDIYRSTLGSLPDGRLDLDAFNQAQRALTANPPQTLVQAGVTKAGESRRGDEFNLAIAQLSDTLALELVKQGQECGYPVRAMSFNPQAPGQLRTQLEETVDYKLVPEAGNPQPGNPENNSIYGSVESATGANVVDPNTGNANRRRVGLSALTKVDEARFGNGRTVLHARVAELVNGEIVWIPVTFNVDLSALSPDANDADHDGVANDADRCPNRADPEQLDTNQNGIGDACELEGCTADPGTEWGDRPVTDFVECETIDPALRAEYPEAPLMDGTGSTLLSNVPLDIEIDENGVRRIAVTDVGTKAMWTHSAAANTPILDSPEFHFPEGKIVTLRVIVDSTTNPRGEVGEVWLTGTDPDDPFGTPVEATPGAGSDEIYRVTGGVLGSSASKYKFQIISIENVIVGEGEGEGGVEGEGEGEGAPEVDGGFPTEDAGKPELDAGTPTPDEGTPDPDAGFPEQDAGTPDAGNPEQDAGNPPSDTGTPIPDEGTPDPDAGFPEQDTGNPSSDSGEPKTDSGEGEGEDPDSGVNPDQDSGKGEDVDPFWLPDTDLPVCTGIISGPCIPDGEDGGQSGLDGESEGKPIEGDTGVEVKEKKPPEEGCSVAASDKDAPKKTGDWFKLALLAAAGFVLRRNSGERKPQ